MSNFISVTDQTGTSLWLKAPASRIVSLVPSQTELLAALDLQEEVVGITKFCVEPQEWFSSKKRIGGTKDIRIDEILKMNPDLILANKEENVQDQVETLRQHIPVYTSQVATLEDALEMIQHISILTNRTEKGNQLRKNIEYNFSSLHFNKSIPAAYLIWREPFMAAGGDTFISDMLSRAGISNLLIHQKRYPTLHQEDLQTLAPKLILLSSEPYPFKEKHITELQQLLPDAQIVLADGQYFSWYGSRLLKAPAYFKSFRESLLLGHD
jgi:ABC-type Fe3+-hydroxamate transport system substrate-binding protein